jgi:NADPH:quinone reductase
MSTPRETIMRVAEVSKYGGPDVLRLAERPDPVPVDGKVRVRVAATTVGQSDLSAREGKWAALMPKAKPPIVLGWDFAGEIIDPAPGFGVGDRVAGVYPWVELGDGTGTYAEMVLADPSWLAPVPDGVDLAEAATLSINGLAALEALRMTDVRSGQSLLVTGASGAVGGFAIQLAAGTGAHVIAVASHGDEDYVGSLGPKEIIARMPDEDLVATVRDRYPDGVDAVLDAAGSAPELIGAVRDNGAFTSVTDPAMPAAERGIRVGIMHSQPEPDSLADLVDRLASGQLRTRVAAVMPLAEAAKAHRRLAAGSLRGKLVLTP